MALILGLMIVLLYAEFACCGRFCRILAVVPLATLGGLIASTSAWGYLNVASGVGFIALFGVTPS